MDGDNRAAFLLQRRLVLVDIREPAVRVRHLAVDDVEERLLQRLGDRTAAAVANLDLVDAPDRRDLHRGADEKRLVGDVEHLARQHLFAHLQAQLVRERHHRVASDARQNRRGDRRGIERVVADQEQVVGFEIAVDDPGFVRAAEGSSDLCENASDVRGLEVPSTCQTIGEALAAQ